MTRFLKSLAMSVALVLVLAGTSTPGFANDVTVNATVTLTGGALTLTKDTTAIVFPATTLTGSTQTVNATSGPTLTITDATGTGAGWNVSVLATDFSDGAVDTIPVTGFTFTRGSAAPVAQTDAQPVDPTNGPKEDTTGEVALGTSQRLLTTAATFGKGVYTFHPTAFKLTIPANQKLGGGTFTSVVTFTLTNTP